jgi:hypothetical protein
MHFTTQKTLRQLALASASALAIACLWPGLATAQEETPPPSEEAETTPGQTAQAAVEEPAQTPGSRPGDVTETRPQALRGALGTAERFCSAYTRRLTQSRKTGQTPCAPNRSLACILDELRSSRVTANRLISPSAQTAGPALSAAGFQDIREKEKDILRGERRSLPSGTILLLRGGGGCTTNQRHGHAVVVCNDKVYSQAGRSHTVQPLSDYLGGRLNDCVINAMVHRAWDDRLGGAKGQSVQDFRRASVAPVGISNPGRDAAASSSQFTNGPVRRSEPGSAGR